MTHLETYRDFIKSRQVIVGEWIEREIDNLYDDLSNSLYIYDTTEADKRIKFMETLCLQSKQPYYMKPIKLMPWQKAFFEVLYSFKMADTGLRRFTEVLLEIARKNGKALALDTRIPTPSGDKTIADIKPFDLVYGADGQPVRVIATSEIFYGHKCYEIEFEDGEKITADAEHIWRVREKNRQTKFKIKDLTTQELAINYVRARKDGKGYEYRYRVQLSKALEKTTKDLPVEPYVLGVWLGDGTSKKAQITCGSQDLSEMTRMLSEYTEIEVKEHQNKYYIYLYRNAISGKASKMTEKLKKAGVLDNKHIPDIYFEASIKQRKMLLKGLMDTDGTCSKAGECEFVQKSERLTNDISKLLTSLGIKHSVKNKIATCNGKRIPVYRILFYVDKSDTCFRLERKTNRLKAKLADRMNYKSIVSIKEVESVPTKCLCVDGGLYICGERNTVTHNSTLMAADAMFDLFCGEGGADIVCASNDDKQCRIIFEETAGMRSRLDPKSLITGKNLTRLYNKLKNINMFRLSAKSQAMDGFNLSKTYLDESHDMDKDDIAEACWRGMSAKDEPLFINCTTQGFVQDKYLDKKIQYAKDVIEGVRDDIHFLAFLYEQDSESEIWQDKASWEKSNPAIRYGVKKIAKLERDIEVAKSDKGARIHLLCKDFNIKQNSSEGWLTESDYGYEQAVKDLEEFRGCYCLAAVDLAETTDLSNCKLLFMREGDPTKYVYSHYWLPESKLTESSDRAAGAEYKNWARDGYVTITEGTFTDNTVIADWLAELKARFNIRILVCGYDQRFSKDFLSRMDEYGIQTELIQQAASVMSTPMKWVEADFKKQTINYGLNPVDKWCFANACIQVDNLGRCMCVKVKGQHAKRIDGAVTLIILYATLQRFQTEFNKYIGE